MFQNQKPNHFCISYNNDKILSVTNLMKEKFLRAVFVRSVFDY